jgi:hypothetical protein
MEVTKCLKRPQSLLGGVAGAVMLASFASGRPANLSYGSSERSPAGEGISVTGGATPSLTASVLAPKRPPRD